MLHDQYHALKTSLVKTKIEHWISEWENLRSEMINQNVKNTFENDVIFVYEFLRADKKWVFVFCEIWKIQHRAAEKNLSFFKTTRAYRNAYENFLKDDKSAERGIVEAAMLQEVSQNDANSQIDSKNDEQNDDQNDKNDKENSCVCDQVHHFRKWSYIVSENWKPGWKENLKTRNEARQKIQNNIWFYKIISRMININILNDMKASKRNEKEKNDQN